MMEPGFEVSTTAHLSKYVDGEFWFVSGGIIFCLVLLYWASSEPCTCISLFGGMCAVQVTTCLSFASLPLCWNCLFTHPVHLQAEGRTTSYSPPSSTSSMTETQEKFVCRMHKRRTELVECERKDYFLIKEAGTARWVWANSLRGTQRRWHPLESGKTWARQASHSGLGQWGKQAWRVGMSMGCLHLLKEYLLSAYCVPVGAQCYLGWSGEGRLL